MNFDEPRMIDQRAHRCDCRVVAFGMADSEHRAGFCGRFNHPPRPGLVPRHRLFHQHRRTSFEKRQRDVQMRLGRDGNRHRIDRPRQIDGARGPWRLHTRGNVAGARDVDVDDARQLGARQLRQYPRVMLPQRPHANHRYPHCHSFSPQRTRRHTSQKNGGHRESFSEKKNIPLCISSVCSVVKSSVILVSGGVISPGR